MLRGFLKGLRLQRESQARVQQQKRDGELLTIRQVALLIFGERVAEIVKKGYQHPFA